MAKKPNPDLVKYIQKHLAKGFSIKEVKKRLAEVGHPIEAIEDAAAYVSASSPKTKKKIPRFMVVYGLILIVLIAGFLAFIWYKAGQQAEYTDTVKDLKQAHTFESMTDVERV